MPLMNHFPVVWTRGIFLITFIQKLIIKSLVTEAKSDGRTYFRDCVIYQLKIEHTGISQMINILYYFINNLIYQIRLLAADKGSRPHFLNTVVSLKMKSFQIS